MYVWHLWGDVWQVGDEEDLIIHLAIVSVCVLLLAALTVIILLPSTVVFAYQSIADQRATAQYRDARLSEAKSPAELDPAVVACPHCGNVESRDISPCVRCGR